MQKGVAPRSSIRNSCAILAFISQIELETLKEAQRDEYWTGTIKEELNQFERNEVRG